MLQHQPACPPSRSPCLPSPAPRPPARRKKKAKKYIQVGTVRRPTAATVCEAYFASAPAKTSYLRADALALLLALANVGAHARVLVVEGCGGLVTAAVAERLGGICGSGGSCGVASAWPGGAGARRPGLDMWRHFNFTPEQRAAIRFAPLHELLAERRRQQQEQQQAAAPAEQQPYHQQQQQQQQQEEGKPMQTDAAPAAASAAEPAMQVEQQEQQAAGHASPSASAAAAPPQPPPPPLQPPFNCCILASSSVNPLALVRHVLPLLAPSASLAVFCPWQQPLVEALDALRGQGEVAGVALHESWWREMQVSPYWGRGGAGRVAVGWRRIWPAAASDLPTLLEPRRHCHASAGSYSPQSWCVCASLPAGSSLSPPAPQAPHSAVLLALG
jgi:tRNA (adenine-N(1)-)-methyltransferase non-catalytic subunit